MVKLVFLILPTDRAANISTSTLPTLENDDVTIMCGPKATGDPDYKINVHGTDQEYVRKRNASTVLSCGADFDDTTFATFLGASNTLHVYSYEIGLDVGPVVCAMLDAIEATVTDAAADKTVINVIKTIFTDGGNYYGRYAQADGRMTDFGPVVYNPAAGPPGSDTEDAVENWNANTQAGIINLINIILPAIMYDGFNPDVVRKFFIGKFDNEHVRVRSLLFAFSAYAFIANSITKLEIRRVDVKKGKKLLDACESYGIKKKDRSRHGLTLPRLAICFMPEYLMFRRFYGATLQNQTDSEIDVSYKDICFYGCPSIRSKAGYEPFHIEFSTFIVYSKDKPQPDVTDEKFLKIYKRWNKVSKDGYRKDTKIHSRMAHVMGLATGDASTVYEYCLQGMNGVYSA